MTAADPTRDLKLATALAYQDQYRDKPPSESRWIQAMRNANDAEIAQLEAQGAVKMITKGTIMHGEVHHNNVADEQGRPAGGETHGRGFTIEWQNGPLAVDGVRSEPNGAFVEDIIEAAIGRIEFYQGSQFHCIENAVALGHLKAAAEALAERTRGRERRGVEGTHAV